MKELKEVIVDITEILDCAEMYAKEAVKNKSQYPDLSEVYARIAQDYLTHVGLLHKSVVEMIDSRKRAGVTVPDSMQAVWDFEHDRFIDKEADVRRLLAMYKG